ncbi:MAG: TlpA family protein disulfide reductase [Mariniphaga sp.]|nr:TlpA family protein disulfide reductase [Mariniphaga sp.]
MKNIAIFLLVNLFALTISAQLTEIPQQEIPEEYGYIVKIGQTVPEFEMELTDGSKVKMSELRGKIVMLQFTASWCSVCRKEMPHIEKDIWLKNKNNKDFALYGLDMDEPLDKVKRFEKEMKITYPLALDPGADIFYTFAAKGAGVTRNIIIDKNGKIVYMTRLFKLEEFDEMVQVIDLLLKS